MRIKFYIDKDDNVVITSSDNEEVFIKVTQEDEKKIFFISVPETSTTKDELETF